MNETIRTIQVPGLGLGTILFFVFLTLKLAEIGAVASWSWWWVTAPLWATPVLGIVLTGVFLAVACIVGLVANGLLK